MGDVFFVAVVEQGGAAFNVADGAEEALFALRPAGVGDLGFYIGQKAVFLRRDGVPEGGGLLGGEFDVDDGFDSLKTYEVHFGAPTPGGIAFGPDVGTAIHVDGIPFGIVVHDVDRDGQVEVMFTVINPGVFKAIGMIIGALITGSVSLDLEFYRMEGGRYPDQASASGKVKSHPGGSGERTVHSAVLIGDVSGDGRADLLVQEGRDELRVFAGVTGPESFARRPQKVAVAMPKEEYTWLVDLNADGVQDVLLHHPSNTEPQRVTTLIAR